MAMGRYQQVEAILCQTYRHQYLETGTWPQWFMFDEYAQVQQQESHGDIVVWPLKALADYLLATDRVALLDTRLSYTSIKTEFRLYRRAGDAAATCSAADRPYRGASGTRYLSFQLR